MEGIDKETAQELIKMINQAIDRKKFANVEIEKISLSPAAASTTYSSSHTTSIRHKRIIGVALNITDESELEGCTMSMDIDSKEVFPSGTEAKMLFASTAVPPNERFYSYVDREISQTKVDVTFTTPAGFGSAFTANFYLMCVPKD